MSTHDSIRIMHFSDVHFGVENYGRYDPKTGMNSRLLDFSAALKAACTEALDRKIEVGIFTGDAYKTRDPNQTHQREFAACLGMLTDAGIPVVLLAGNHDVPNTRGRANAIEIFAALAGDRLHVIDRAEVKQVATATGRVLQIAGLPYITKSSQLLKDDSDERGVADTTSAVENRYELAIEKLAAECALRPELPTVFMGHFTVSTVKIGQSQATYLINEPSVQRGSLTNHAFDYVAMGHIHKFQDLNAGAQPPIVYCGSIERIDFGERSDDKGVVFADVSRGKTTYEFFKVPTRPFVELEVDLSAGTEKPTEAIVGAITRARIENAVVKLSYKIRSQDRPHLRENEIRAALQDAFLVLAINRDIVREESEIRSRALAETIDPIAALRIYIDGRESLKGRKEELLAFAEGIVREVDAQSP